MTNRSYNNSRWQFVSTTFGTCKVGLDDYGHALGGNWSSADAFRDEPHAYDKLSFKRVSPLVDCQCVVRVFDHWERPPGSSKVPVYRDETRYARGTVDVFGTSSFPDGYPSDVESKLNAKLAAKVRDASASLLVTAGEAGETIYMLRDATRRVTGFCWSLYKKQWLKATGYLFPKVPYKTRRYHARKMRHLYRSDTHRVSYAKTLLEYEFGWRPLVNDIQNCQDALSSMLFHTLPVKVKAQVKYDFSLVLTNMTAAINTGTRTERKTLWLDAAISPLSQTGITFPDLITAVYNLIPFSFVVDWAWNLNAYLDTWATKQLIKPLFTQRSVKEQYAVGGFTYAGPKGYDRWFFVDAEDSGTTSFRYTREPIVPGWDLALPPFLPGKLLEMRKLTDALALCRERFRHITFKN